MSLRIFALTSQRLRYSPVHAQQAADDHLGTVHFPISCTAVSQRQIARRRLGSHKRNKPRLRPDLKPPVAAIPHGPTKIVGIAVGENTAKAVLAALAAAPAI